MLRCHYYIIYNGSLFFPHLWCWIILSVKTLMRNKFNVFLDRTLQILATKPKSSGTSNSCCSSVRRCFIYVSIFPLRDHAFPKCQSSFVDEPSFLLLDHTAAKSPFVSVFFRPLLLLGLFLAPVSPDLHIAEWCFSLTSHA